MSGAGTRRAKVVLITRARFWIKGHGLAARTREMMRFLAPRFDLSVVYLDALYRGDGEAIQALGLDSRLFVLGITRRTPMQALAERFRLHFNETSPPATYIVVQTELSSLVQIIPSNGRTLLDTNDLISDRTRSVNALGVRNHFPLSEQQEAAIFRNFDHVLLIQRQEHAKVSSWIGADKALLVPHLVAPTPRVQRDVVNSIGFVASRWHANVDGIRWFLERVWPRFHGRNISLDLYGFVCEAFEGKRAQGLRLHGFVDELETCYSQIDIAINPVRYGAGLKIKSVEALAFGLPLVAPEQGSSGLEDASGRAFLCARDEHQFAAALESPIGSPDLRRSLGEQACAYAAEQFSAERCFGVLAERISG